MLSIDGICDMASLGQSVTTEGNRHLPPNRLEGSAEQRRSLFGSRRATRAGVRSLPALGRAETPMVNIEPTFRPATGDDALCISVLAAQVFVDTYATLGIREAIAREVTEELSVSAMAASIANSYHRFIVAEVANHLVGFVQLKLRAENTRSQFPQRSGGGSPLCAGAVRFERSRHEPTHQSRGSCCRPRSAAHLAHRLGRQHSGAGLLSASWLHRTWTNNLRLSGREH